MYEIAICDDKSEAVQDNARMVREIMINEGYTENRDFSLEQFESRDELLHALKQTAYDVLLLDIELNGENGIMLARQLRENNINTSIIFITAYDKYMYDSFYARPLQYILKPVEEGRLAAALYEDYRKRRKSRYLHLLNGSSQVHIPFENIRYLEAMDKTAIIYTGDSAYSWSGSMNEFEKQLPRDSFFRCHRSYIVNLKRIFMIRRYVARLDDGREVPIGRSRYNMFAAAYLNTMK